MRGLTDKVAVIAGGGSGIGAATARRLAEEGAAVVVGDLVADNAEAVAAEVRAAGGRAGAAQFDITVDEEGGGPVGLALSEFGGLDHQHPNAAGLAAGDIGPHSAAPA